MHRTEEITTNAAGGKQSKLYTAYHLMDPRASHAHAAILHRGEIKYGRDNWRQIAAEQHINRAIAHLNTVLEYIRERDHQQGPAKYPVTPLPEDDLAHALCRVHMALAMEINYYGFHPEHFDPMYHECQTASVEPNPVRDNDPGVSPVYPTEGLNPATGNLGAPSYPARWNFAKRSPQVERSPAPWPDGSPDDHKNRW